MSLDERFAEFRVVIDDQVSGARSEGVRDVVRAAARMKAASTEAEQAAVLRDFSEEPAALDFLKTLAVRREEKYFPEQRFARVRVAEMQLYHAAALKGGRASHNVYQALKAEMDAAREAYREKFVTPGNGTADYLHKEFVRTLAQDDAATLGPDYPGPLV